MLSYAEQFLLLTIDPVSGRSYPVRDQVLRLTLAGALLFDASFTGLINDDHEQLTVLRHAKTSHPVLLETMRCLLVSGETVPLSTAMTLVAAHFPTLHRMLWDSMVASGLLAPRKKEQMMSAPVRDLYQPHLPSVIMVHKKIREAILKDDIPEFQIPALVSLITACGLTSHVLKPEESAVRKQRIQWLAGMESLGREISRLVRALKTTDIEHNAAGLIGMDSKGPKSFAGGIDSALSSLSRLYKEAGIQRGRKIIANFNQEGGFECPGCAWPNPDTNRSPFEFCENGAKSVCTEATKGMANPEFFEKWPVEELLLMPGSWLGQQGRLTHPMILNEGSNHYQPISWDEAYRVLAEEMNALENPDEAIFYASGRTSIEAAFLYQLLARTFGTNNLPSSANLCHEPSGVALNQSLGFGKGSVTLDDFPKADAILLFGHNPGSNHPRMLKSLQEAARKGCRIIAVNPMPEAGLFSFANPKEAGSYFGRQTTLAQLFIQPMINGDMALVRGIIKSILEEEKLQGGIIDHEFIRYHTSGFSHYKQMVADTSWEDLVKAAGVDKAQIEEAARIYCQADNVIACWCLGITHHLNAIPTIREIINLLLLRGNIGKPGAGACPVRGQSNIQGIRTAGVGGRLPIALLEAMEKQFLVKIPRKPGMTVVPAIRSLAEGKAKVLISLGGNLAEAVPDTSFTEKALRTARLTVMISTSLNRSHLVTGKRALILPCLSRTEEDFCNGLKQMVSIEDTFGKIGFSEGCLPPASPYLMSETAIISNMALALFKEKQSIDWNRFGKDNHFIRTVVAKTIPALRDLAVQALVKKGYYLDNPLRKRTFKTSDAKAHFGDYPLENVSAEGNELIMMTIRSHDQFNTVIFGLDDRYRGIHNERKVLLMNRIDLKKRGIAAGQPVDIISYYNNQQRKLEGYYAIPYPIRQGCVAAYFPEANAILSFDNVCTETGTPAYKSILVTVKGRP